MASCSSVLTDRSAPGQGLHLGPGFLRSNLRLKSKLFKIKTFGACKQVHKKRVQESHNAKLLWGSEGRNNGGKQSSLQPELLAPSPLQNQEAVQRNHSRAAQNRSEPFPGLFTASSSWHQAFEQTCKRLKRDLRQELFFE